MRRTSRIAAVVGSMLALGGCKLILTADKHKTTSINSAELQDKDFDHKVAGLWESKLLPYVNNKAGPLKEVLAAIAANPEEAGQRYGFKERAGSSPGTLIARVEGQIVSANTATKASTIDVDSEGDGRAVATIQIGPVIRGTAIRDSLDFVNFNDFTNQIDFAQFGKALNAYVYRKSLESLPRDSLIGKRVKVLGAFPQPQKGQLPLIAPIALELAP